MRPFFWFGLPGGLRVVVPAVPRALRFCRHCEERSDAAISQRFQIAWSADCRAALAMTEMTPAPTLEAAALARVACSKLF